MAQDFVSKRRDLATAVVQAVTQLSNAADTLREAGLTLLQSGGSFSDSDFTGTSFPWLNAYNMNVAVGALSTDLQAFLAAGTPKHDDVIRGIKQGV